MFLQQHVGLDDPRRTNEKTALTRKGRAARSGLFILTLPAGRFEAARTLTKKSIMTDRIPVHGLQVARSARFHPDAKALPGSGVDAEKFWSGFAALAVKLMPQNSALLAERDRLQAAIDGWHKANPAKPIDADAYTAFLKEIGYLKPEGADFQIGHPECRSGNRHHGRAPQLVVPLTNARFRAQRRQCALGQPV